MLRTIEIDNIRGIHSAKLEGFTGINVFVGPNGSGKSTLLDAIRVGGDPNASLNLTFRRAQDWGHGWFVRYGRGNGRIFITSDAGARELKFAVLREGQSQRTVRGLGAQVAQGPKPVAVHPQPFFGPGVPEALADVPEVQLVDPLGEQAEFHDLWEKVATRGLRIEAKNLIKEILPNLVDVDVMTPDGKPALMLHFGDEPPVPADLASDGLRTLLRLALQLVTRPGGIVLLEEPETHLHPRAIRQAARAIHAGRSRGTQIFISTHSLDMIDALLAEGPEDLNVMAVYRLRSDAEGDVGVTRIGGSEAGQARADIGDDLR